MFMLYSKVPYHNIGIIVVYSWSISIFTINAMLTWGLFPGSTDFVDGKKSAGEISEPVGWTFDEVDWEETKLLDAGVAIEVVGLIMEMAEVEMLTDDGTTLLEAGVPIELVGVIMEMIEVEIVTDDGLWNNCTAAVVVVLCRP